MADKSVRFLGLFRSSIPTRADRPNRLVSNHRLLEFFFGQVFQASPKLNRQNLFHVASVALLEGFADADNWPQCRFVRGTDLLVHDLVRLAEQATALAVPENDVMDKQIAKQSRADLAGKRAVAFPMHVLRSHFDALAAF